MDLFEYATQKNYKRTETSQQAAISIASKAQTYRKAVYESLVTSGSMTCHEVASLLSVDINSIRPRFTELFNLGLIQDTNLRRPTPSGKSSIVWGVK